MKYVLLALFAAGLFSDGAFADEMVMKNGSRIVGTLVSAGGGKIKFDTPWGGTLEVNSANVESISTDTTHTVLMADGEVFRDKTIVAEADRMIVENSTGAREYDIEQIDLVNPEPWQLGDGYRWTGRARRRSTRAWSGAWSPRPPRGAGSRPRRRRPSRRR